MMQNRLFLVSNSFFIHQNLISKSLNTFLNRFLWNSKRYFNQTIQKSISTNSTLIKPVNQPNTNLLNSKLVDSVKRNDLNSIIEIFKEFSSNNLRPNIHSYNLLLNFHINNKDTFRAMKLFEEMNQNRNFIDITTFNLILTLFRDQNQLDRFQKFLDLIRTTTIGFDKVTFSLIIDFYGKQKQFDQMRAYFHLMRIQSIPFDIVLFDNIFYHCLSANNLKEFEFYLNQLKDHFQSIELSQQTYLSLIRYTGLKSSLSSLNQLETMKSIWNEMKNKQMINEKAFVYYLRNLREHPNSQKEINEIYSQFNLLYLKIDQKPTEIQQRTFIEFFNCLLKYYLDRNQLERFELVLNDLKSMNREWIRYSVETYSILFEWTSRIGSIRQFNELLKEIKQDQVKINEILFTSILNSIIELKNQKQSKSNQYLFTTDQMKKLFESYPTPNLYHWTCLMKFYAQMNDEQKLLKIFDDLKENRLKINQPIDIVVYQIVLNFHLRNKRYEQINELFEKMYENTLKAKQTLNHQQLINSKDNSTIDQLNSSSSSSSSIGYDRNIPFVDAFSFNILIKMYSKLKRTEDLLSIINRMKRVSIEPILSNYTLLIDYFIEKKDFEIIKKFHQQMIETFKNNKLNISIFNVWIRMYLVFDDWNEIELIENQMKIESIPKNLTTYLYLIDYYLKNSSTMIQLSELKEEIKRNENKIHHQQIEQLNSKKSLLITLKEMFNQQNLQINLNEFEELLKLFSNQNQFDLLIEVFDQMKNRIRISKNILDLVAIACQQTNNKQKLQQINQLKSKINHPSKSYY